jgi:hypothetical protein
MEYAGNTEKVEFITGLTGNAVLNKKCETTKKTAEREHKEYGRTVKLYHSFM